MSLVSLQSLSRTFIRSSYSRFSPRPQILACKLQIVSNSLTNSSKSTTHLHAFSTHHKLNSIMSSKGFSNTSTGDAPADPYKAKNKDDPSLEEKIETLNTFVSSCKFGMMTTHSAASNRLVSRCMAVAAKVCISPHPPPCTTHPN
jgi:hypothetical protein